MRYAKDRQPPGYVRITAPEFPAFDFDDGLDGVDAFTSSRYTTVTCVPRGKGGRDFALRVENRICGNDAAVRLKIPATSLGARPILCFDYRMDETVRADFLFLTYAGGYVVGVSDTESSFKKIGQVPDIVPDGKWHHAEVDVARLMARADERFTPQRFRIRRLAFGDWGYAAMPPGAAYELDNVVLAPVISTAGEGVRITWTCSDPSGIRGYSFAWGDSPDVRVDDIVDVTKPEITVRNLPEGDHWLGIRACDGAGNWGPVRAWRFRVDNTPPQVAEVFPKPGEGAASPAIRVRFSEDLGAIDSSKISLTMNGNRCALSPAYTDWDAEKREMRWEWVRNSKAVAKPIPDGSPMEFRIEGLRDFAGNLAKPFEWTWRIDYSKDKEGPDPPRVYCYTGRTLRFDDFSQDTGWWRAYGGDRFGVEIERVTDPVTRDHCLMIRKKGKGRAFAAYGYAGRLSLTDYPYVFFDIRIPKGVKVNMILHVNGEWRAVRMTEPPTLPVVGEIDGVAADGKWHHVWLDLRSMLAKAFSDSKEIQVRYLALGDWSVGGNPIGARFYVDNFGIVGPAGPVPDIYVSDADPTGIAGYAVALDRSPRTTPPPEIAPGSESRRPSLPLPTEPGLWFIHVRARDGAGNWGAPAHTAYYCATAMLPGLGDGLESTGRWRAVSMRGGSGSVRPVRPLGEKGTTLAGYLRFSGRGSIMIGRFGEQEVPVDGRWTATLYHDAPGPVRVAPFVRVSSRIRDAKLRSKLWRGLRQRGLPRGIVTGPFKELPAGRWNRRVTWDFDIGRTLAPLGVTLTELPCREVGFVVECGTRGRASIVVDEVGIAPASSAAKAGAKGKRGGG